MRAIKILSCAIFGLGSGVIYYLGMFAIGKGFSPVFWVIFSISAALGAVDVEIGRSENKC